MFSLWNQEALDASVTYKNVESHGALLTKLIKVAACIMRCRNISSRCEQSMV